MANKDELLAQAKEKGVEVPEGATKAEIQEQLDRYETEGKTPAETVAEDVDKSGIQGVTEGSTINEGAGEDEPDAQSDGANDEDQTVAPQADLIDGVDRDNTPAGTTDEANQTTDAVERLQPPRAATGLNPDATDDAYNANNQVNPALAPTEVKAGEVEYNTEVTEARRAESKEVETDLGTSEEEAAAARAGVDATRLENPKQNREPKNVFEESNQKVTEEERQAAQEISDMTTADKEDQAPTPHDAAQTDAARTTDVNQNSDVAAAIREGFQSSKKESFKLEADAGVDPRFSLVKNKDGDVMVRENETGHLSRLQLKSIEEQEASIQNQEVEEL